MEEDQELKHVCKLCYKSFPCGRSLGGHMRSHVIHSAEADQEKVHKKKLSSISNGGKSVLTDAGYGLRDNPKKTSRFADASGETLPHDKVCKECGKGSQSWKALFEHTKSHSEKISHSAGEEQDSWTSSAQSDNETAAPYRKKRSSRTMKRYNMATTASSLSVNANASSSVSEIEQEQEEVAMCLIMLSEDVNHWSGELAKFKKLRNGKLDSKVNRSESQVDDLLAEEKVKKSEVFGELEYGKVLIKESESDKKAELGSKHNSRKRKVLDLFDPELGEKSKFECASCKKTFHSYQALGGHKSRNKKKQDGCVSKIDGIELNSFGIDQFVSPIPNADSNSPIDHGSKKREKGSHECPICFRVFSSGQALGGHKRAHLLAEAKNNQNNLAIQKPIPEIRDFLDLNMPAPVEEDSSSGPGLDGFKPWLIGNNHKHELLLSLLTN